MRESVRRHDLTFDVDLCARSVSPIGTLASLPNRYRRARYGALVLPDSAGFCAVGAPVWRSVVALSPGPLDTRGIAPVVCGSL